VRLFANLLIRSFSINGATDQPQRRTVAASTANSAGIVDYLRAIFAAESVAAVVRPNPQAIRPQPRQKAIFQFTFL
jgi:hypothetical protein